MQVNVSGGVSVVQVSPTQYTVTTTAVTIQTVTAGTTGPNQVTSSTSTNLTGYLTGNGSTVSAQAVPIPLTDGGTGGTSAATARTALGLGTAATHPDTDFALIAGANTFTALNTFAGTSTSNPQLIVKMASGQSNDTLEIRDNSNVKRLSVTKDGALIVPGSATANGGIFWTNTSRASIVEVSTSRLSLCGDLAVGGSSLGVVVDTGNASAAALTVKGASSQSGNLQEWQDLNASPLSVIDSSGYGFTLGPTFALAVGVPVAVATNLTNVIVLPRAGKITKAFAAAKTGPTGAALIFDINLNGTTIWSTQGNRLQIAAGSTTGTQTSFNTTNFAEGDQLTIDVDQIGSTVAGQDITVTLLIQVKNQ